MVDLTVVARVKAGHPHLSVSLLHRLSTKHGILLILNTVQPHSTLHTNTQNVLSDLKELRAETSRVAKSFSTRARNAVSAMEARDLMVEGTRELEALYNVSVS